MRLKKSMCQSPGYGKTQLNEPPYSDFNFLNGHKISCPNNNLILKLYPNLKLFVKNIQSFQNCGF